MHHVVHRVLASRSVLRTSMLVILVGAFWPHSALAQQAPANQSAPQVISCVVHEGSTPGLYGRYGGGSGVVAIDRRVQLPVGEDLGI